MMKHMKDNNGVSSSTQVEGALNACFSRFFGNPRWPRMQLEDHIYLHYRPFVSMPTAAFGASAASTASSSSSSAPVVDQDAINAAVAK